MNSISIETSRDNYEILKINKNGKDVYIGSKYNQKRELDKFINSFNEFTENDIYIVIGAGMLEHIDELLKINTGLKKILIIEVSLEVRRLVQDKIKDSRIHIATTLEEVNLFMIRHVNDMNINFVKIGYYANYDKVFQNELKEILGYIKDESYNILGNKNTNVYFGEIWFQSIISNLKYMKNSTPINDLKDKFKGTPAFIVSAGPSLSKNIKELKSQKKGLVLSGGRTLNTLLNNEVQIDYLGVVDPGQYSYELVKDRIDKVDIPLVYYNGSNIDVVANHKGKKVFCTDNKFIRDIFEEDIEDLTGGGSVAHFLTKFAIYTGCNPIIFVGQDLAYTGEKNHDVNALTNRNDTNVAWKQANDLYVDDIKGGKVRTSVTLNDFRLHLEQIIKVNPDIKFINATEGGSNIKGTEVQKLAQVMNSLNFAKIQEYQERIIENGLFKEKIQNNIKLLEQINKKANVGITLTDELNIALKKRDNKKINSLVDKLEKVDSFISSNNKELSLLQNKIFANMYEISNSPNFVIGNTDSDLVKQSKNLAKSKAIYIVMAKHSEEAKEALIKIFEEL